MLARFMIQSEIDEIFDKTSRQEVENYLIYISTRDQQKFQSIIKQLKQIILAETQSTISYIKLIILELACKFDKELDTSCFKTNNIYQLVSVSHGYLAKGFDVKGIFARNLKKSSVFWGVSSLEIIQISLRNNSLPNISKVADLKCKQYLWNFISCHSDFIPTAFDFYQYALKHLLMLRSDKKQQQGLFNLVLQIFTRYQHSYQILSKNCRLILQFFRTSLSEKEIGYFPYSGILQIVKNYKVYQIDSMLSIGSLGLSWTGVQIQNCISNIFRLGINQQVFRLLKSFIQLFKSLKKYHDLVDTYEKNMHKIFVFIKYPQLYAASLKTLKQFVLGPWAKSSIYNIFATKCIQFSKVKNINELQDFKLLILCVIEKYKDSTLVSDLQNLLKGLNIPDSALERVRPEALQYDWRAFQLSNSSTLKKDQKNGQLEDNGQYRGIINIGNSCYMNSFLQSLYMNKQYRKKVLETSTLSVEKQVFTKYEKLYPEHIKEGKNLAVLARQTVRPLAELQRFFSLLLKSKRSAINPTNIKNICPIQFQNTHQHDSIQFGRFLIQSISRSIGHFFEGQMTTQIECPFCQAKREKKQQFLDLMLGSSDKQIETIQQLIKITLEDEHIQNLTCQSCQNKLTETHNQEIMAQQGQMMNEDCKIKHNKSIKRHWISKYPDYLILTLKRFQYSLKQNKNVKKQFKLELNENLFVGDTQYLISSFIVHRGSSANSGHYFTFSRCSYSETITSWVCLNDAVTTRLDDFNRVIDFLSVNQQDTPYIIFAIKKSYWVQNCVKLEEQIILRPPLQSYVQKDDSEYVKSLSKKGTIDLSMLKFGTGSSNRRDQDDDDKNGGFPGMGLNNNPIM